MPGPVRPSRHSLEKQIVLPWSKAASIALESMRVRFGRSLITSFSIALACLFLVFILIKQDMMAFLRQLNDADVNFMLQKKGIDVESNPGLEARALWLIGSSLVVCLVGVSNALLMSVTERIKEIGTMKCLGALNSFVVKLFMLEALFMGTVSSTVGAIGGLVLCVAITGIEFGAATLTKAPWLLMIYHCSMTIIVGTILSVVAAIYPSLLAARMQPVEALRKEV